MRLRTHAVARILDWHFEAAAALSAVCLPVSLLANGWRKTLLAAFVIAPVLFLIWLGDRLSTPDAGSLLTWPMYKEVIGRALVLIGWFMLASLLGRMIFAPLFQLMG